MKKKYLSLIYWMLLCSQFCCMTQPTEPILSVVRTVDFSELPSGSGLSILNDSLYVVGDDAPYLYTIGLQYELLNKQLLLPQHVGVGRISKQLKPDLESLTPVYWQGRKALMAFGSGSQSPERDSLLVMDPTGGQPIQRFSLSDFYDTICRLDTIERQALNIEGAVLSAKMLWLMNRGRNSIITVPYLSFSQHLVGDLAARELPLQLYTLQLPQLVGKQARFSGACAIPGTRLVLFTATVEDTDNWINDGEILGSIVGIMDQSSLQSGQVLHNWPLKDQEGQIMKEKLESIEVLEKGHDSLKIVTIADNDDGSSRLFELHLSGFRYILNQIKPDVSIQYR